MRCAIIGGGAAGLMAACSLARSGADVTVFERQPRVGKKLLATGNGRCNFTNLNMSAEKYHGSYPEMSAHLERFSPERIMREFEEMGIPGCADSQGRVYPASNAASSVLDALRLTLSENGGCELTGFDVTEISRYRGGFVLRSAGGQSDKFDCVLVACGGAAAPKQGGVTGGYRILEKLGHRIVPALPCVAPVNTDTAPLKGLKGQRARCTAILYDADREVYSEDGEVLFAEYGLSGICIMQFARRIHALKNPVIGLDLAPGFSEADMYARVRTLEKRPLEDFLNGIVQRRLGWNILKEAGICDLSRLTGSLSRKETSGVWRMLRDMRVRVKSVCGLDSAQVTAGGVDMTEIDPVTFMSGKMPGVYVAGEVCDVDGDCGGYNLHWAWSSALAAAEAMVGM